MKKLKLLTASLLAAAMAASAVAAVNIHLTGSTAFRKATYVSLIAQLGGVSNCVVAFKGSANGLLGSNQATLKNNSNGDVVYCCFAGSVGGVNWVANQIPAATSLTSSTLSAWISLSGNGTYTAPSADGTSGGTALGSPVFDGAQVADVTMSDSLQSSTPYNYVAPKQLTDDACGVVTFTWAKGTLDTGGGITSAQYNAVTNMTVLGARNLIAGGTANLSMFSGVDADSSVDVVLTGRDSDSGTRLGTFAETGWGPVTAGNVQYAMLNASSNDVGEGNPGPITQTLQFSSSAAGYSSGGKVKACLTATMTGATDTNLVPFVLIGYVGLGDTPGSAQQLNWNGVPYSDLGVQEGTYTFWTKEHLMYRADKINAVSSSNKTFADALAPVISSNAAVSKGETLASMKVDRSFEGDVVSHL